ncbi:MAG: ABC transporter permease subunit [Pseudonocardiaceae bacterium]|nr:ABC transporter permease subunit [Pseudonocardiaceae bacterium]
MGTNGNDTTGPAGIGGRAAVRGGRFSGWLRRAWSRSNASRLGMAGGAILVFVVLMALLAPVLTPYELDARGGAPFRPPSGSHLLGTNDVGRDILTDLVYGSRVSVVVGFVVALVATVTGTLVGTVAGYFGGAVDNVAMRLVDLSIALPFLPLLIVLAAFLGTNLGITIFVISLVLWARPARVLRSQVLSVKERGDVQAARAMGGRPRHILRRHVLPGIAPLIIAQFVQAATIAILIEASLAFLGLGDPTRISWGTMLYYASSRGAFLTDAWMWWVVPPGLAISAVAVGFAFVGYALEELADPRLRNHRVPALVQLNADPAGRTALSGSAR